MATGKERKIQNGGTGEGAASGSTLWGVWEAASAVQAKTATATAVVSTPYLT